MSAEPSHEQPADLDDPNLWLEDVQGEKPLDWVRARNEETLAVLQKHPEYERLRGQVLEVMNARDRIPYASRVGQHFYNLWQDDQHKRGLWRRTTLDEYRKSEPAWDVLLDLDELGDKEQESWVFHGANFLGPDYRYCLISLSRGGADAAVVREFDTQTRRFVAGGFEVPEAKTEAEWLDADTLLIASDFGPGSLTDSGYPRTIRRWKRGSPLAEAPSLFEGEARDVSVGAWVDRTPGHLRVLFTRAIDFYNQKSFLYQDGKLVPLDLPTDVQPGFWGSRLLLQPRQNWRIGAHTYLAGSLLICDANAFLKGQRQFDTLFKPSATRSLAGYSLTASHVLLNISDQVASRLEEWSFAKPGKPVRREIKAPFPGTLSIGSLWDNEIPASAKDPLAEAYLINYTDFLTPDSLYLGRTGSDERELLKSRAPQFGASGMRVEQFFARSKDGTQVPYFVVWPARSRADGKNPTLLYGYGGFEISMRPGYSGSRGRAWIERGGVFVLANIRGGGEFGPAWHQAAVGANKQRSYDDFIAVAEDLILRKITTPAHLGIMGGSNGGLLVGATFVQRPDLFNAVVCQVPLLDMKRYHKLLAGASWMAEYGDPDQPADWDFIRRYSPYQQLKPELKYPRVFFTTSTRDDRVHPGHARKMAARMIEQRHPVLYYENIEGGHGGAADNEQRATLQALEYSYLWLQLGAQ